MRPPATCRRPIAITRTAGPRFPAPPDHHLMFPAIYHLDRDTTSIDVQASYDGKLWHRLPGSPVLETADFGEWNGGCVFATPSLLELANGDWALPFTGYDVPHKYPRGAWNYRPGLAVWPKGRLAAIVADEDGFFNTTAVVSPGSRLLINAVTDRAGEILIEAANLAELLLDLLQPQDPRAARRRAATRARAKSASSAPTPRAR